MLKVKQTRQTLDLLQPFTIDSYYFIPQTDVQGKTLKHIQYRYIYNLMNPTSVLCYYTSTTVNLPEVRLTPASLSLRSLSQKTSRLVDPASTQHMQNSIQDSATQHSHGDKKVQSNTFSHA